MYITDYLTTHVHKLFTVFLLLFHALTLYYYFQWDGSRFSRSREEKPEASTAVLPIVQGSVAVHLVYIIFLFNYLDAKMSL
jgi:hypothetical protein